MNPITNRLLYLGAQPSLDLSSHPKQTPSWQQYTLSDSQITQPGAVADLMKGMHWERMFDLSGNLLGQFRSLGMTCPEQAMGRPSSIMVDDPRSLSAEATVHAHVLAMIQSAAMELRRDELENDPRPANPSGVFEVSGIAYFASSKNRRGTGKRLTQALCQIARDMTERCNTSDVVPGRGSVQFMHALPVQFPSPVVDRMAVPVAAYRLRFCHMSAQHVIHSLREALEVMQSESDSPMQKGDVLVLSSLWAE